MADAKDTGKMLEIAGTAARVILENGAETYRVEDTVLRLCHSYGFADADVMALSTGVFITVAAGGQNGAVIRRVRKRGMNLSLVNEVNELSRRIAGGNVRMDDALFMLKKIAEGSGGGALRLIAMAGLSAGCFTLMFGGGPVEFALAALCGALAQTVSHLFRRADISLVLTNLVGAMLCSAVTMAGYHLFRLTPEGVEATLGGAIMPLISGLMMTNAVRDSLRGDLLSGLARGFEAMLVAMMVALGISVVLRFYLPSEVDGMLIQPPWMLAVLYAGLATMCFCTLLRAPARSVLPVSLLGAAAYAAFWLLENALGCGQTLSLFLASMAIAFLCELLARRMRMIATVFLCVALVPLVPGLGLYRTMRELLLNQYEEALPLLLQTLFAVGAIALGAAIGSLPVRYLESVEKG